MRVGFIGLGNQGAPIARRIAQAGLATTVWARRPETLEPFAGEAFNVASSPAAVGAASDLVGLCLFDADGIREVMFGADGVMSGLGSGGHVVVHSTLAPAEIREIAARAGEQGITVLDAPVSGGAAAALAGTLSIMIGGSARAVEHCRPVLTTYSDKIFHLGDVGAGQLAKLVNNLTMAANLANCIDALQLGAQLGIDQAVLGDVLRSSSARSFALESVLGAGPLVNLAKSNARPTLAKDIALIKGLTDGLDTGQLYPTADHFIDRIDELAASAAD